MENKLSTRNIIGFSLTILLVVQFFLLPFITKLDYGLSPYFTYIHIIFSYFAITSIIVIERQNLRQFYIDHISLWLFMLTCFVRSRLGTPNELTYVLPIMLVGGVIFFVIMKNGLSIPRTDKKAVLQGTFLAFIALTIITIVESFQANNWINPIYSINNGMDFFRQLIFQLSFVILIEEIVFRGLLPGYLIKIGLNEKAAFTIQAILFWLAHYPRSGNLITFLFSIPMLTLSSTFTVQRFKQLFPSIIIHTFINGFVIMFINLWF